MKHLFIFLAFALGCISKSYALDVKFESQLFGGKTYLVLITDFDDDKLLVAPLVVKFYLADDSFLYLSTGESAGFGKTVNWTMWTNSSNSRRYYRFEVTPEMMEAFSKGIKGIAINTLPEVFTERFDDSEYKKFMSKLNAPKETDVIDF